MSANRCAATGLVIAIAMAVACGGGGGKPSSPAALEVTISAPSSADRGQPVAVSLTITNVAGADAASARIDGIRPSAVIDSVAVPCIAATPPLPLTIAAGRSVQFRWSCTPDRTGVLTLEAQVAATDTASGDPLSVQRSAGPVTIQSPAELTAYLSIVGSPTEVVVGAVLAVGVTVSNVGGGAATIEALNPEPDPPALADCYLVEPSTPVALAGGATADFTFHCTAGADGALALGARAVATSVNAGGELVASADAAQLLLLGWGNPEIVPGGAPLDPAFPSGAFVVDVGQTAIVTFTVVPALGSDDGFDGVTLAPSVTGATCGEVVPSTPQDIEGAGSRAFTWLCAAAQPGTMAFSAAASGTIRSNDNPATYTMEPPSFTVPAQHPADLHVQFLHPETVGVNESWQAEFWYTNWGGASAWIRGASLSFSPATGVTCELASGPSPGVLEDDPLVLGLVSLSCTATIAGTYQVSASMDAGDTNWARANSAPTFEPWTLTVQ
jgi:hypothetical protein